MMNNEQTLLVENAIREYNDDGLISTTTFMALTLSGLDANSILESIELAAEVVSIFLPEETANG